MLFFSETALVFHVEVEPKSLKMDVYILHLKFLPVQMQDDCIPHGHSCKIQQLKALKTLTHAQNI